MTQGGDPARVAVLRRGRFVRLADDGTVTTGLGCALADADSQEIRGALLRRCDQCGADRGVLCHNHVQPGRAPLPGRLVHFGRLETP